LVAVVGAIYGIVDAEAGVAQILRNTAREVVLPVVELARRERYLVHPPSVDYVDGDDAVVIEARMEELHGEAQVAVQPQRAVGREGDASPLVVAKVQKPLRYGTRGVFERRFGKLFGKSADSVHVERRKGARDRAAEERQRGEGRNCAWSAGGREAHVEVPWILHLQAKVISLRKRGWLGRAGVGWWPFGLGSLAR